MTGRTPTEQRGLGVSRPLPATSRPSSTPRGVDIHHLEELHDAIAQERRARTISSELVETELWEQLCGVALPPIPSGRPWVSSETLQASNCADFFPFFHSGTLGLGEWGLLAFAMDWR